VSGSADDVRLMSQLADATAAAQHAYRDNGRLIRLLTVLGGPAAPDEVLSRALAVLSEAFNADVVLVASVVGKRLRVTAASGLADDDPTLAKGWGMGSAATAAVTGGQPMAWENHGGDEEIPPALVELGLRTGAFVPMSALAGGHADEVLVLYRSSGERFSSTDLHLLATVAYRMRITAEDRERRLAELESRLPAAIRDARAALSSASRKLIGSSCKLAARKTRRPTLRAAYLCQ